MKRIGILVLMYIAGGVSGVVYHSFANDSGSKRSENARADCHDTERLGNA
jgi:hypothetical protein